MNPKTITTTTSLTLAAILAGLALQSASAPKPADRQTRADRILQGVPFLLIPTAVNSPGRHDAHFKTRVVLHNMSTSTVEIDARLFPADGPRQPKGDARRPDETYFDLKPNQYRVWDNFLQEVFDYRGAGGVFIGTVGAAEPERARHEDHRISALAEIYTDSPNGRQTTTVLNGLFPRAPPSAATRAVTPGVTVNANQRVKLGAFAFYNGQVSDLRARVYSATGKLLETIRFDRFKRDYEDPSSGWQQEHISAQVENGRVEWEWDIYEGGTPICWVVTVDNRSHDRSLVWSTFRRRTRTATR